MNIPFLAKIAQKSPALARFLEGIILGCGATFVVSAITAVIAFLNTGDKESLSLGLYAAVVSFAVSFLQSLISAINKWRRDITKKSK